MHSMCWDVRGSRYFQVDHHTMPSLLRIKSDMSKSSSFGLRLQFAYSGRTVAPIQRSSLHIGMPQKTSQQKLRKHEINCSMFRLCLWLVSAFAGLGLSKMRWTVSFCHRLSCIVHRRIGRRCLVSRESVVLAVCTGPIDMRLAPWTLLRHHRHQLVPPQGYTNCWSMRGIRCSFHAVTCEGS